MKKICATTISLILACAFLSTVAKAHKYHASFVTMNYNQQEKSVEIIMRLFPDDLEAALTKQNNRTVHLDSSKEVASLILAYLNKTFELKKGDKQQTFSWVGMDLGVDNAYMYFEAKMPEGLSGAQVRNHFLFELYDDQANIVTIKHDGKQTDQVFRREDGKAFKQIP
jgi:hypothetical protein